ncbi:primosomal protein N' [Candidatus Gracilibacteria bacterium]|nr:primosomal protein N' [Candidatus Gracilibacteria bacterium]
MYIVNLLQNNSSVNPYVSSTLLEHIEQTLQKKEKILLYMNKRGEYSSLICESCQYLFSCDECDTPLSVHTRPERLVCHLCDKHFPFPRHCPSCNSSKLKKVGVGTQQIETVMQQQFPHARLYRFDTDNIKNKSDKIKAFSMLEEADIIIGTKMITTGFNIPNLGLIGVILLEQELQIPGYNTEEQVYSNINQLLGRGGRVGQKTEIILQTYIPENPLISRITTDNYKEFFKQTLKERKRFNYPPFCEMVTLISRHNEKEKSKAILEKCTKELEMSLGDKKSQISLGNINTGRKKQNKYVHQCIIKGQDLESSLKNIAPTLLRTPGLQVIWNV